MQKNTILKNDCKDSFYMGNENQDYNEFADELKEKQQKQREMALAAALAIAQEEGLGTQEALLWQPSQVELPTDANFKAMFSSAANDSVPDENNQQNADLLLLTDLVACWQHLPLDLQQQMLNVAKEDKWLSRYLSLVGTPLYQAEVMAWLWSLNPQTDSLQILVEKMANKNNNEAIAAMQTLELIKDKRVLPLLAWALMQPYKYTADKVVTVMKSLGDLSALVLVRLLAGVTSDIKIIILEALGSFPPTYPLADIASCLHDANENVRISAIMAIKGSSYYQAGELLVECLNDPCEKVRAAAVAALGDIGYELARENVLTLHNDTSRLVRNNAVDALDKLL